jgi:hypothetical protein
MLMRYLPNPGSAMFALLLTLCSASVAGATLSTANEAALLDAAHFQIVPTSTGVPAAVLACCGDPQKRLAAPGERWAPADVLAAGSTLARHRLIWMAQGNDLTVVHFEQGGIAHTYHVVVLRNNPMPWNDAVLWRATGPHVIDYAQFVQALRDKEFTE